MLPRILFSSEILDIYTMKDTVYIKDKEKDFSTTETSKKTFSSRADYLNSIDSFIKLNYNYYFLLRRCFLTNQKNPALQAGFFIFILWLEL